MNDFARFLFFFINCIKSIGLALFSACGKTTFVKELLLHHFTRIQLRIQRIVHDDLEENTAFQLLWKIAKALNKKRFYKMVDQLTTDGEEKEEAGEIAEGRIKPYEERTFFEKYKICLNDYFFPLQTSAQNEKIDSDVERLISKGLKQTPAIKRSLMKYRGEF